MKLQGKLIITGKLETITGLHVGGSKNTKRIGDIDNNVIKSVRGIPYIPGSSLKGKLRSLLAKQEGTIAITEQDLKSEIGNLNKEISNTKKYSVAKIKEYKELRDFYQSNLDNNNFDEAYSYFFDIFGAPGNDNSNKKTRLLVRDAYLNTQEFEKSFEKVKEFLDDTYTQTKWENVVDRVSGTAKHPRQLERVPAGSFFDFKLVYDVFDDEKNEKYLTKIRNAMQLLQNDYLGGSGSRGYGEVKFVGVKTEYFTFGDNGFESTENPFSEIFKGKF